MTSVIVDSQKAHTSFTQDSLSVYPTSQDLICESCYDHPGVVGLGVVALGVVAPLSPAALLFLLDFFSLVPGVVGLFSLPLVAFLTGPGKSSVFSCGVGTALFAGVAVSVDWLEDFETSWPWLEVFDVVIDVDNEVLCDFDNLNAPGSPTIGFSSIYSLP